MLPYDIIKGIDIYILPYMIKKIICDGSTILRYTGIIIMY